MPDGTLNLTKIVQYFTDEDAAYKLLEGIRWPNGPICPHCGVVNHAMYLQPEDGARKTRKGNATFRRVWKCKDCRKQFSVLVGTIFEDSHIPLSKWLMAIHELCSAKNGVAANEIHRTLGLSYRSAWFMMHRIRYAMKREPLASKLQGIVEADETYVGGRAHGKRGRGAAHKTPVVTLVERNGEVRSKVMKPVTSKNVRQVLKQVDPKATLMTDDYPVYTKPGKDFAAHEVVNHSKGEYVRGNAHTNTAEGYFSQLKRSLDGTHHHVSEQHLHRYVTEFDFRYNLRKIEDAERTAIAVRQSAGKRLTYQQPTTRQTES